MRGWAAAVAVAAVMGSGAAVVAAEAGPAAARKDLVIASGEVTGTYYPVAGALCRILDKDKPDGVTCSVMPTSGSAANVAALRSGEADLAIVQSRAVEEALRGGEGFAKDGAFSDLRALMSLHAESTVVMTRPDSGISQLADIKGKRVNLGQPGSFQRSMADAVLDAVGLSEGDMAPVVELDLADEAGELCGGNIDVAFFSGVHPMAELAGAIDQCGAVPVPYTVRAADLKRSPWLSRAVIPGDTYDGIKSDMNVLGVRAVLVGTTRLPEGEVADLLKSIHANFRVLGRLHPALKDLDKAGSTRDGIAIPLHDGARKFYGDAGLLK